MHPDFFHLDYLLLYFYGAPNPFPLHHPFLLARPSHAMWKRLRNVFRRREVDAAFFAELEDTLLAADVGSALTAEWIAAVRPWKTADDVQRVLQAAMIDVLKPVARCSLLVTRNSLETEVANHDLQIKNVESQPTSNEQRATSNEPRVIMIIGINGVGKTTTIAKLAKYFQGQGRTPLLVAGDTFRAAAVAQLQTWGDRLDVPVIAQGPDADAAAVAFDGIRSASARGCDVVLVDTAGRLHTKAPLMDELAKVKRVMGKALPGAPHECWCILDAMTGHNALAQVKKFHEALTLTGLIVTKLDGTAKAGVLFSIAQQLPLPVHFIGTGEQLTDLAPFVPENFVRQLVEE